MKRSIDYVEKWKWKQVWKLHLRMLQTQEVQTPTSQSFQGQPTTLTRSATSVSVGQNAPLQLLNLHPVTNISVRQRRKILLRDLRHSCRHRLQVECPSSQLRSSFLSPVFRSSDLARSSRRQASKKRISNPMVFESRVSTSTVVDICLRILVFWRGFFDRVYFVFPALVRRRSRRWRTETKSFLGLREWRGLG